MHAHATSVRTYFIVLIILVVMTFVTVGVSFAPIAGGWHIAIGLAIALVKASLVALFFMHVIRSERLTWIAIAMALFWLTLLFALTFTDYLTRGLVPRMPGH